jgi:hypothetical protein
MDDRDEAVRLAVYRGLAASGRMPATDGIAAHLSLSEAEVAEALEHLAAARHVVFDDEHRIVLAHPFATRSFGFSVMGGRTLWWGGCAWDAFAIPHLVPDEPHALIATTCPACGRSHAWTISRTEEPDAAQVAHFLVPVAHVWDDVVHTCSHQRIFCSEDCVDAWLERTGNERGYVMDLPTLWRLAAHWYEGRLDSPYRRREPAEAKEYFASVGLTGPFWGN